MPSSVLKSPTPTLSPLSRNPSEHGERFTMKTMTALLQTMVQTNCRLSRRPTPDNLSEV